jgi:hypothetical protein
MNSYQIDYKNFEEVVVRRFGFVRWASINNRNIKLLCSTFYRNYHSFQDMTYDEFYTELDTQFFLTNRSKVTLSKVNKSFIVQAVKFFLQDLKRKLDRIRVRASKMVSLTGTEELTEVPVSISIEHPQLEVKTEAQIMLNQILETLDEDERHLVLYKLGRISNEEVRDYFGGVSNTIISRRWKKLQQKLDLEFGKEN